MFVVGCTAGDGSADRSTDPADMAADDPLRTSSAADTSGMTSSDAPNSAEPDGPLGDETDEDSTAQASTREEPLPATMVVWQDAEVVLPAPWRHLPTDDADLLVLHHPTAASPSHGVMVVLEIEPGLTVGPVRTYFGERIISERTVEILADATPATQLTLTDSIILASDRGAMIRVLPDTGPDDAAWDGTDIPTLLATALEPVLDLVGTIQVALPDAAIADRGSAEAATPTAPRSSIPTIRTTHGPPFPDAPPVPMIPGATLIMVEDFPYPGDRCNYNGVAFDCADPAYIAELGWSAMPSRTWVHLLPSVDAMWSACTDYLQRALEAGLRLQEWSTVDRQCVADRAHGFVQAYITGFLPDGSRLDAKVRNDDPGYADRGLCGSPCPTIHVGIRFP